MKTLQLIEINVEKPELFLYVDMKPEVGELCIYNNDLAIRNPQGIMWFNQHHRPFNDIENAKRVIGGTMDYKIIVEPYGANIPLPKISEDSFKDYLKYSVLYSVNGMELQYEVVRDKDNFEIFFDKLSLDTIKAYKNAIEKDKILSNSVLLHEIETIQLNYLKKLRNLRKTV